MKQEVLVSSPGRINIIGEHTDYNDGFVMPAAIDKKMLVKLWRNGSDSTCQITARDLKETYAFDLNNYARVDGGWRNYMMGVVNELEKLGAKFQGFDGHFESDIPIGGGMSSSAALVCSFAFAFNELYDLGFDKWQLMKAARMAEHNFVGIKSGVMDHFASVMGQKNQLILLDCRSLDFEYVPLELGEYQLLLLNTNVSHALANSAYGERQEQCNEGVDILSKNNPSITSLRDVSSAMLAAHKSTMPELIYKRCKHVVEENERVVQATQALKSGDIHSLGQLIYASHQGLQHDYEVSCEELDFLVQHTKDNPSVLGSRMMGGGFGGCTINIIEKKKVTQFIDKISIAYRERFSKDLSPYEVAIEGGTRILE